MNIVIVVNKERGDLLQQETAKKLKDKLEAQGVLVNIVDLTFENPNTRYYDSFPRIKPESIFHADGVIVLGGDGSKNYIANQMIHYNISIPMIGVTHGSHNVGKLNTAVLTDFDEFEKMTERWVSGLKVQVDDSIYYAFHDIIFASTFITGYEGKSTQLSAKLIMDGVRKIEAPKLIGDSETNIEVIRGDGSISKMPIFDPVGLISSAELGIYPKYMVISGAANHPINEGAQAGVIVSSERIVWPDRSLEEYTKAEPIITAFASYSNKDVLHIKGLNNDAYLIIDGNAVCPVGHRDIKISNKANAIKIKELVSK